MELSNCSLCLHNCKINRLNGELGFCKASDKVKLARASLHYYEEPIISGVNGSGCVFFSHCNLKCVFCQNYNISQEGFGEYVSINRLSNIFLELQDKGANNINLVTPTHYVPQIKEALDIAKNKGLTLPILYNTNGYDSISTIKSLNGYIDVYLRDFKYFDDKYATKYSSASNYCDNIIVLLKEMVSQTGKSIVKDNLIKKGVIVRHLMLPGLLFDSKKIIDKVYSLFQDDIYLSIMNQYTPMFNAKNFPEINKPLNSKHYSSLIDYCIGLGINKAFIQDEGTNSIDYIPSFDLTGVLKK